MLCCSWLWGASLVLVILLLLHRSRKRAILQERLQKLRDKANSWPEADVKTFDPESVLSLAAFEDMKDRLKNRIVQSDLNDPDNTPYGTPSTFVNLISERIINKFDFAGMSETLCQYKHYKTLIGDVNLHFIHVEGGQAKSSTPILLLHGWPSTVWEFSKSLPLLIEQGYTVVVPSLPGSGFTEPPTVPGVSPAVIACVYHKLMCRLGYRRYVVHGGDWGAITGSLLTFIYPEHVRGFHTTFLPAGSTGKSWRFITQTLVGSVFPLLVYTTKQEREFVHPLSGFQTRFYKGFAYFHVQAVMPDSLGFGMVDSPVGLIAWIGDRFVVWSADRTKSIKTQFAEGVRAFGIDNICAHLAIFWANRNSKGSMRIYHEFYWRDQDIMAQLNIPSVPVAVSNFPHEIFHLTQFVTSKIFGNIVQWVYHKKGGHFSHLDNTEAVVSDLCSFINKIEAS